MDEVTRAKDDDGTERWATGERVGERGGVDVYPPSGDDRRDEVCVWEDSGRHFDLHPHLKGADARMLSCTLREWADGTSENGGIVASLVIDLLGLYVKLEVDDAVRALLPRPKSKSYHVGWDTIQPDPGDVESWDCRVCGDACDVRRNAVGRRSSVSPHKSPHDHFTCPNAGEPWHDRALRIRQAIEDMPAPSVRALMEGDVARILEGRSDA